MSDSPAAKAPLTLPQKRLWELERDRSSPGIHTFALSFSFTGSLDPDRLRRALSRVVARHAVLRAALVEAKGEPSFIESTRIPELSLDTGETGEPLKQAFRRGASGPLDPRYRPPWELHLIRRPGADHLVLHMHHLISDRWSVAVFMRHLSEAYTLDSKAPAERESFSEFAAYQAKVAGEEPNPADVAFWKERFAVPTRPLRLPQRPGAAGDYRGARLEAEWDEAFFSRLREFAESRGALLFPVLLASFAVLLRARTGQSDLVVCTPVVGRHRPDTRHRIGYFNNLLPLRVTLEGDEPHDDVLRRVSDVVRDAFSHQDVGFETLASLPGAARARLSRCLLAVQNIPGLAPDLGLPCTYRDIPNGTSNFDLSLFLEPVDGGVRVNLDFKQSVLSRDAAQRVIADFRKVLEARMEAPHRPAAVTPDPDWDTPPDDPVPAPRETSTKSEQPAAGSPQTIERLSAMWSRLFPEESIGPDSNFFALGGDSMQAARLTRWVQREFDCSLPVASLMEAPTPGALAARLDDPDWVMPWESLIPIRSAGNRPPLFCVHGGGGNVFSYQVLSRYLHPEQPVYGLQARGLSRSDSPLDSVEEMAAYYLEAIKHIAPRGPYILSGHSLGAVVAYEMAQRLTARGERVALLAILDHPGPAIRLTRRDWIRYHMINMSMLPNRDRLEYVWRGLVWRFNVRRAKQALKDRHTGGEESGGSAAVNVLEASMKAIQDYVMQPYPGRLSVFRAERGSPRILSDPLAGWGDVAGGGVDIHDVRGTHMTMFREPYIASLGHALDRALEEAQI